MKMITSILFKKMAKPTAIKQKAHIKSEKVSRAFCLYRYEAEAPTHHTSKPSNLSRKLLAGERHGSAQGFGVLVDTGTSR